MKSALHIGTVIDDKLTENLGKLVKETFEAGAENHMDQSTIVAALGIIKDVVAPPRDVTVNGCQFQTTEIRDSEDELKDELEDELEYGR